MMYIGLVALAGTAVVNHARIARRQTKGSRPGRMPPCTRTRSWGEGGVRGLSTSTPKFLLAHHPRPAVPQASCLGCPRLSWAAHC